MVPLASDGISPVPPYSGYPPEHLLYTYGTITLCGAASQRLQFLCMLIMQVLQPRGGRNRHGLGYSPFARHYLGNHYCFLFLRLLRCFSSPGWPPLRNDRPSACRVVPFGNLRINSFVPIPAAYRSLTRPSSPPRAKASPIRPYLLSCSTNVLKTIFPACQGTLLKQVIYLLLMRM